MSTLQQQVLDAIADGATDAKEIADATALGIPQIHSAVFFLKKAGKVGKDENGYTITDSAPTAPAMREAETTPPPQAHHARKAQAARRRSGGRQAAAGGGCARRSSRRHGTGGVRALRRVPGVEEAGRRRSVAHARALATDGRNGHGMRTLA